MTRVRVRFLPGVPPTRGPGLGDADLWAIRDIQAGLSPEKWKRAVALKSHRASGAACAHFTAALSKAAWLCRLPSPLGVGAWTLESLPSPIQGSPLGFCCNFGPQPDGDSHGFPLLRPRDGDVLPQGCPWAAGSLGPTRGGHSRVQGIHMVSRGDAQPQHASHPDGSKPAAPAGTALQP